MIVYGIDNCGFRNNKWTASTHDGLRGGRRRARVRAGSAARLSPSVVTRLVAPLESARHPAAPAHHALGDADRRRRPLSRARAPRPRRPGRGRGSAPPSGPTQRATRRRRTNVFGRLHVTPLMCRYLNMNPAVDGELMLSDRIVNLVEDGIDLAVRIGHLGDSSLIARRAGTTRRVLVASPSYLNRRGVPATPLDLARHQTIQFSPLATAADWSFREGERRAARRAHFSLRDQQRGRRTLARRARWRAYVRPVLPGRGRGESRPPAHRARSVRTSCVADSICLSVLAPAVREGTHVCRAGRGHLRLAILKGVADGAVREA